MVNVYLNLSNFTVFLKNKIIIFKIKRSKLTDYAALRVSFYFCWLYIIAVCFPIFRVVCYGSCVIL